jgi:hypothetical protein
MPGVHEVPAAKISRVTRPIAPAFMDLLHRRESSPR